MSATDDLTFSCGVAEELNYFSGGISGMVDAPSGIYSILSCKIFDVDLSKRCVALFQTLYVCAPIVLSNQEIGLYVSKKIDSNKYYDIYDEQFLCCGELQFRYVCKTHGNSMECMFCAFDSTTACDC